ncbi:MAG: LD-carboxypeptidase [Bacteroides sp.]|nr:LD-carboxypeptidase [Bacteroides sp.]MBD5338930.1 LD-carboxypeptidase [Bacteroides sp.]
MINKVAIISPATEVNPNYIDGAVAELRRRGIDVWEAPHARGPRHGTYAASDTERLADLRAAILDPAVDVILCARGGYGCVHLLSDELESLVRDNPKWLVGFSDVSALHALWLKAGVPSLHASMAKQLTLYSPEIQSTEIHDFINSEPGLTTERAGLIESADAMMAILDGSHEVEYTATVADRLNAPAIAEGEIVGGNLAVLNGLAGTPWDILTPDYLQGKILFLEDVGEKIYQVERMLKRLQLAGVFNAVSAVIFGTFTDYRPDRNYDSMEAMIAGRFAEWGVKCPVAIGFPIGHQAHNLPVPEGCRATLRLPSAGPAVLSLNIYR